MSQWYQINWNNLKNNINDNIDTYFSSAIVSGTSYPSSSGKGFTIVTFLNTEDEYTSNYTYSKIKLIVDDITSADEASGTIHLWRLSSQKWEQLGTFILSIYAEEGQQYADSISSITITNNFQYYYSNHNLFGSVIGCRVLIQSNDSNLDIYNNDETKCNYYNIRYNKVINNNNEYIQLSGSNLCSVSSNNMHYTFNYWLINKYFPYNLLSTDENDSIIITAYSKLRKWYLYYKDTLENILKFTIYESKSTVNIDQLNYKDASYCSLYPGKKCDLFTCGAEYPYSGWDESKLYQSGDSVIEAGGQAILTTADESYQTYSIKYNQDSTNLQYYTYDESFQLKDPTQCYSGGYLATKWQVQESDGLWTKNETFNTSQLNISANTKYGGLSSDPIQLQAIDYTTKATRYIYYINSSDTLIYTQSYQIGDGSKFATAEWHGPEPSPKGDLGGVICYIVKYSDGNWETNKKFTPADVSGKTASTDVPSTYHGNAYLYCRWNLGCETVTLTTSSFVYNGQNQTVPYSTIKNEGGCTITGITYKDAGNYTALFTPNADWAWDDADCNTSAISRSWTITQCPLYVRINPDKLFNFGWTGKEQNITNSSTSLYNDYFIISRNSSSYEVPYDTDVFSVNPYITVPANDAGTYTVTLNYTQNNQNYTITNQTPSFNITISPVIIFNANGGSGNMDNQVFTPTSTGYKIESISANEFTYEDHLFVGWKCSYDSKFYADKSSIEIGTDVTQSITLTAIWVDSSGTRILFDKEQGDFGVGYSFDENQSYTIDFNISSTTAGEALGFTGFTYTREKESGRTIAENLKNYRIPAEVWLGIPDSQLCSVEIIIGIYNGDVKASDVQYVIDRNIPSYIGYNFETFDIVELNPLITDGKIYGNSAITNNYFDQITSIIDGLLTNTAANRYIDLEEESGNRVYNATIKSIKTICGSYTFDDVIIPEDFSTITKSEYDASTGLTDKENYLTARYFGPIKIIDISKENLWKAISETTTVTLNTTITDSRGFTYTLSKEITIYPNTLPHDINLANSGRSRTPMENKGSEKWDPLLYPWTSLRLEASATTGYSDNELSRLWWEIDSGSGFNKLAIHDKNNFESITIATSTSDITNADAKSYFNEKEFLVQNTSSGNVFEVRKLDNRYNMSSGSQSDELYISTYKLNWEEINQSTDFISSTEDYISKKDCIEEDTEYNIRCYVEDSLKNISDVSDSKEIKKHIFKLMTDNPIMDTDFDTLKNLMNKYSEAEKKLTDTYNSILDKRSHITTVTYNNKVIESIKDSENGYYSEFSVDSYIPEVTTRDASNFIIPDSTLGTEINRNQTQQLVLGLHQINNSDISILPEDDKFYDFGRIGYLYNTLKNIYNDQTVTRMISLDSKDADIKDLNSCDIYDPDSNISDKVYELNSNIPSSTIVGDQSYIWREDMTETDPVKWDVMGQEIFKNYHWQTTEESQQIVIYNEENSCQTGCMGHCSSGCYASCVGGCNTCCGSDCGYNCGNSCKDMCRDGCSGTCEGDCTGGCGETCDDQCYQDCKGDCVHSCTGTCIKGCSGNCGYKCQNGCQTGCNTTCTGDCLSSCTSCRSSCTTACDSYCGGSCSANCGKNCLLNCQDDCTAGCIKSCLNICKETCNSSCGSACSDFCKAQAKQ